MESRFGTTVIPAGKRMLECPRLKRLDQCGAVLLTGLHVWPVSDLRIIGERQVPMEADACRSVALKLAADWTGDPDGQPSPAFPVQHPYTKNLTEHA